jgi:hypothetical protein
MTAPRNDAELVRSLLAVSRQDVVRAKNWIVNRKTLEPTHEMINCWLREDGLQVDEYEFSNIYDMVRTLNARLAFCNAIWELVAAAELFLVSNHITNENKLSVGLKTPSGVDQLEIDIGYSFPANVRRPPSASDVSADIDIFLKGIDCATLHPGIEQAIQQHWHRADSPPGS